jgi:hypothetical protein
VDEGRGLGDALKELRALLKSGSVSSTPGPKGDKGDKGDPGERGERGLPGLDGQDGANGQDGADGDVSACWPVGSVFMAVVNANPQTLLGFGTWQSFGAGRMLVGVNGADADFDTAEKTGGSKTSSAVVNHTHSVTVTDNGHNHTQNAHTHVQDAHSHTIPVGATDDTAAPFDRADAGTNASGANATTATGTAVAVNQSATATNNAATTGITASTANPAGGVASFSLMNPYIAVYLWKRTA